MYVKYLFALFTNAYKSHAIVYLLHVEVIYILTLKSETRGINDM